MSDKSAVVEPLPEVYHQFHRWSSYGSYNHTRDNPHWDAINPSHGFVAIDRKEATARNLPLAMYLPSDHSKGVYLLEAYHQLHCLVSISLSRPPLRSSTINREATVMVRKEDKDKERWKTNDAEGRQETTDRIDVTEINPHQLLGRYRGRQQGYGRTRRTLFRHTPAVNSLPRR